MGKLASKSMEPPLLLPPPTPPVVPPPAPARLPPPPPPAPAGPPSLPPGLGHATQRRHPTAQAIVLNMRERVEKRVDWVNGEKV
jgi:hypothetical protein